jgi:hypothetical protein
MRERARDYIHSSETVFSGERFGDGLGQATTAHRVAWDYVIQQSCTIRGSGFFLPLVAPVTVST